MKSVTADSRVHRASQNRNPADSTLAQPSLSDRYDVEDGSVFLSGIQALVRLPIEQMRRDERKGLHTKAFITGYPGSPLGGYDIAMNQARAHFEKHGIKHLPGQNEELAATTLMGTQMVDEHPSSGVDGVVAYWYGKGPGLDRSGDALKHGNFAGTSKHGAVVILSGEDHEAKSSSVPYQQEFSFEHHGIPVLYPSNISEFVEYGLHAAEMSRYSGCWVALKLVGPLCDGGEVVTFRPGSFEFKVPATLVDGNEFEKKANFKFFPVTNVATERQLYVERHAAVHAYTAINRLNRVTVRGERDRIGIISAGKTYSDVRQALEDLGLTDSSLKEVGIRIAKVGVLCPLDSKFVREFAHGLDKIIVVEEKRDFLERQIGRAVCDLGGIKVVGKFDSEGQELFPQEGGMTSDGVAELLSRELRKSITLPESGILRLTELAQAMSTDWGNQPRRTLNFCSGCPHNVSTKLADGQVAWGAPGCHIFAAVQDSPKRRIEAVTQLGGEGLPWIGLAPYTARKHIVQNMGDGSLMHSSYQNIRFAVTANVNITFRILFNGVIANTGGQISQGAPQIVELLGHLALEGVKRIILVAKEPARYRGVKFSEKVTVRTADKVESTMKELSEVEGVTVLIYDGECANERRRRQKRGKAPAPTRFTVVNEDVCENCGDCGRKANCMSLQKVDTEFGPKTQIHQSSCNQDQACIEGECPSFVTVEVDAGVKVRRPKLGYIDSVSLPERAPTPTDAPYSVYVPGLGGTGVITANAILAQAAALDGSDVKSYDQTGAAQKWGAVLSSLIISAPGRTPYSNRVGLARANLYLVLDPLAGVDRNNLMCCSAGKTNAVINSDVLPSGDMIRNPRLVLPKPDMLNTIRAATNDESTVVVDARRVAEGLFGDYVMANMVTIGAAHQAGLLPISASSIEAAIRLNGTQVDANVLAFRAGRLSQHDPIALERLLSLPFATLADKLEEQRNDKRRIDAADELMSKLALDAHSDLRRTIHKRVTDLIGYQSNAYASRYVDAMKLVADAEMKAGASDFSTTEIVARNLYKLMAYKDEYEVARLLLQKTFKARVEEMFTGPVRLKFNLQPPLMRWFGLEKKVALGSWIRPLLSVLAAGARLRGTRLDPFGYLEVRKEERELISWYFSLVEELLPLLSQGNLKVINAMLSLPEDIRGYEQVKSKAIQEAKSKCERLRQELNREAVAVVSLSQLKSSRVAEPVN